MATLPYQPFPEEEGVSGAIPEQHPNVIPGAFGAGIAQATGKFGDTLEKAGQEQFATAIKFQQLANETAANKASQDYADYVTQKETEFRQLQGTQAVDAFPAFQKDLQDRFEQTAGTLQSPMAQLAFQRDGRSFYQRTMYGAGLYTGDQAKRANDESWKGAIETEISQGALHPENTDAFNQSLAAVTDKALIYAHGTGQNKDAAEYTQQKAVGELVKRSIDTLLSKSDLEGAKKLFEQMQGQTLPDSGKPAMDPASTDAIGKALRLSYTTAAVGTISDAVTALPATSPAPPQNSGGANSSAVYDAIFGQESDYGRNTGNGAIAVGPMQIKPGTFSRYAKPGEDINNPTDNKAVGRRIIDDLSKKYNGDAARAAVAYFSGEGNVAPAGSPTPYLHDVKDANGKSVSSYVGDIQSRLASANVSHETPPLGIADYYRQNYATLLDRAGAQAEAQRPGDEIFRQKVMARTEQKMNDYIRQQELSYKVDSDTVIQAFNGDFSKGARPTSIEQLTAASPQVKAAWDRLTVNNPMAATMIETRMLTANSRENPDEQHYGDAHLSLMGRVWLSPDDPRRISDPSQLYQYVGAPGGLTMSGFRDLVTQMKEQKDPATSLIGKQKSELLKGVEPLIDQSDPLSGKRDTAGKLQMYYFSQYVDRKIQEYRAGKKDPSALFQPGSPDFIGSEKSLAPFMQRGNAQTQVQRLRDETRGIVHVPPPPTGIFGTPPAPIARPPVVPAAQPPAAAAPTQRKPGETPQQYLQRIGAR